MTKKCALITGITGQDGSYLAEFLLEKDYQVVGLVRRTSTPHLENLKNILERVILVQGDLLDQYSLVAAIGVYKPDEVYNLAAQSFVQASWNEPVHTCEVNALGVTRILDAIRLTNPKIRFYQASSSEMYGKVKEIPQNELTPFYPLSPYGVSKVYGHWITVNYRESYDIYAVSGICFNHESPRRGYEFVTRKIARAAARIRVGLDHEVRLGNMDAKRDWGYAPDYVRGMWLMLQQSKPQDYVLATGQERTVKMFAQTAFDVVGLNYKDYVVEDEQFIRPLDIPLLVGSPLKANIILDWRPTTTFDEMVQLMVKSELDILEYNKK